MNKQWREGEENILMFEGNGNWMEVRIRIMKVKGQTKNEKG